MNKHSLGMYFESMACQYLWSLGYNILERNFYTRYGELDIIAKKADDLIVVEVRGQVRPLGYEKYGHQLISRFKVGKLIRMVNYWVYYRRKLDADIQIDFIGILFKDKNLELTHVENITA